MTIQSENERNKVGAIGLNGAPTVQNDVDCAMAALALVPDAAPAD